MSKSILIGALAALAVAGVLVILWTGLRQKPENLQLSAQQWHEDLQFLARELPKRHANAFHFTPRERFEKAVVDLDSKLANADADTAWVGLQRLVSLVGDAHTYLQTPQDSASDLPIDIARFGEDYRIHARGQLRADVFPEIRGGDFAGAAVQRTDIAFGRVQAAVPSGINRAAQVNAPACVQPAPTARHVAIAGEYHL